VLEEVKGKFRYFIISALGGIALLAVGTTIALKCLHITSSNSIVYFLKHPDGSISITNHVRSGEGTGSNACSI